MRIYSGLTPSSSKGLHIGNYFGAVKRFLDFQNQGTCFFAIANLHSLNTVFDPRELEVSTMNIFAEYLALGIDPDSATFFVESDVPEVTFIQTVLNNVVTVAELKRMHGYKDKLAKDVDQESISAGLFEYPVLMAADILLFDIDTVPVGEDQAQHVEIAREMARTFNNRYGKVFVIPEVSIQKETGRILGIDGVRKMSKSLGNDIPVFGDEKHIRKQISSITTDPNRVRATDPGDPSKNICFSYLRLLGHNAETEILELEERYRSGNVKDIEIKKMVEEAFFYVFAPYRARKAELIANPNLLKELRAKGAEKASKEARIVFDRARHACGV
jgi:tryptophanyl-tRNA synthetase